MKKDIQPKKACTKCQRVKNMKAAKFQKDGLGGYQVVDTRNGMILKRNISKTQKAAAYAEYYSQEIAKAEKEWAA